VPQSNAAKPSGSAASGTRSGQSASQLTGKWGFTTISGTTYWDKSTGAYMGSGTGGSQSYTFLGNGRYKLFNYIKARTYGFETQALTWEDGTYTVNGDRITLRPTSGKYQMISSSRNTTRPMTASELQKNVKQKYWKIEKDENTGKPVCGAMDNKTTAVTSASHKIASQPRQRAPCQIHRALFSCTQCTCEYSECPGAYAAAAQHCRATSMESETETANPTHRFTAQNRASINMSGNARPHNSGVNRRHPFSRAVRSVKNPITIINSTLSGHMASADAIEGAILIDVRRNKMRRRPVIAQEQTDDLHQEDNAA
jgi:hypothetical protein